MKGTIVASLYAKSLLDLSIEQNILDKVNNIIYSETNKDGKVIKAIQKHIEYY